METVRSQFSRVFGRKPVEPRLPPPRVPAQVTPKPERDIPPYCLGYYSGVYLQKKLGNPYDPGSPAFHAWALGFSDAIEDGADLYLRKVLHNGGSGRSSRG